MYMSFEDEKKTQTLQLMPLLGLFGTQYNIYNIYKDKSIQISFLQPRFRHDQMY